MVNAPMPEGSNGMMGVDATGNHGMSERCGSIPIYWDLPEAAKLFGFNYANGNDVFQGIEKQIGFLAKVSKSHDGHKKIVRDIDKGPLSSTQIFLHQEPMSISAHCLLYSIKKIGTQQKHVADDLL
jgi:hypothetical protein